MTNEQTVQLNEEQIVQKIKEGCRIDYFTCHVFDNSKYLGQADPSAIEKLIQTNIVRRNMVESILELSDERDRVHLISEDEIIHRMKKYDCSINKSSEMVDSKGKLYGFVDAKSVQSLIEKNKLVINHAEKSAKLTGEQIVQPKRPRAERRRSLKNASMPIQKQLDHIRLSFDRTLNRFIEQESAEFNREIVLFFIKSIFKPKETVQANEAVKKKRNIFVRLYFAIKRLITHAKKTQKSEEEKSQKPQMSQQTQSYEPKTKETSQEKADKGESIDREEKETDA